MAQVTPGRYLVRIGCAYYNYDGRNLPPRFAVQIHSTLVETIDMGSFEQAHPSGGAYFSDYLAFASTGALSVCLQPMPDAQGMITSPILSSLEALPQDTDSYSSAQTGQDVILSNYLRVNLGSASTLGPEPEDPGFRTWEPDVSEEAGNYIAIASSSPISATGVPPNYLPSQLFATARQAKAPANKTGFRMRVTPVESSNRWYLRFYFSELNSNVAKGERLFNVLLGSGTDMKLAPLQLSGKEETVFDILELVENLGALVVPVFLDLSDMVCCVATSSCSMLLAPLQLSGKQETGLVVSLLLPASRFSNTCCEFHLQISLLVRCLAHCLSSSV